MKYLEHVTTLDLGSLDVVIREHNHIYLNKNVQSFDLFKKKEISVREIK